MAGPWEKYQQAGQGQMKPRAGPWEKYQQAQPVQPQQPTAAEAGARSAARAPGRQPEPKGQMPPSQRAILEAAGIGSREAPGGAQFRYGLGAPVAQEPQQKIQLARSILGENAEVQIEPQTGAVVYRMPGDDQFQAFNVPGPSLGDISRFTPEVGVLGSGVLGGLAGGAAGVPLGGAGVGVGTIGGEAAGEAAGQALRLLKAAELGDVDMTPNEILAEAAKRGGLAALGGAVGGTAMGILRALVASRLGADVALLEAMGDRPAKELVAAARKTQQEARQATGQDLPLTLGQQTGRPEILAGEEAAGQVRSTSERFEPVKRQQQEVAGALEERTFGPRVTPEERAGVGQDVLAAQQGRVGAAEESLQRAEQGAFGRAAVPEDALRGLRRDIETGREAVMRPMKQEFDALQQERGIQVNLTPLRREATRLRETEGQGVIPSISRTRERLLKEAERAGLEEVESLVEGSGNVLQWMTKQFDRPVPLGEVQITLQDIRRELRRPAIADEPQRKRILERVESSLEQARNAALDEQGLDAVLALEAKYKQTLDQLDRDIVGDIMDTDRLTGVPKLSGEGAIQKLLRGPEQARRFVTALGSLPNGRAALQRTQDGITGYIQDKFVSEETGRIDPTRLRTFLRNRGNREAMKVLFENEPAVLRNLNNVRRLGRVLDQREKTLQALRSRMERTIGVSTADPAEVATKIMSEANPRDALAVRNILPPDRREAFNRVLADQIRSEVTKADGSIDAGKVDAFLRSNRSRVSRAALGSDFNNNLRIVGDVARLVGQQAPSDAPRDLARAFNRNVSALEGMMRFLRVPFAPLSASGRAATATLGIRQERVRARLAEVMANPEELSELAKLAKTSISSRRAEIILGRLGFGGLVELAKDNMETDSETLPSTPRAAP